MSKTVKVLVRALPAAGFCRAGRHWPREETEAEVTEEQLGALKAEPMVAVIVVEAETGRRGK